MGYLTDEELKKVGFKSYGKKVLVSPKASIYGAENISIGDNVRIDDFALLSAVGGYIDLHNHIHIAAYASIFGKGGVTMKDFTCISSYACLYSASDDYGGDFLVGATLFPEFLNVIKNPVTLEKYTTCGSHSVVLPGVILNEGSILGASSLAIKPLEAWKTYSGVPAKFLKDRSRGLLEKAKAMELKWKSQNN